MNDNMINLIIEKTINKALKTKLNETADEATLQEVKSLLYAAHKSLNHAQRNLIFSVDDSDPLLSAIKQMDTQLQTLMNGDLLDRFYTT